MLHRYAAELGVEQSEPVATPNDPVDAYRASFGLTGKQGERRAGPQALEPACAAARVACGMHGCGMGVPIFFAAIMGACETTRVCCLLPVQPHAPTTSPPTVRQLTGSRATC
jgi:hypothetical protein